MLSSLTAPSGAFRFGYAQKQNLLINLEQIQTARKISFHLCSPKGFNQKLGYKKTLQVHLKGFEEGGDILSHHWQYHLR